MQRRLSTIIVCAALLWMLFPAGGRCADTETTDGSWEAYSIISQRNIFSRTRRAQSAVAAETVTRTPAAVRTEQSYLVLRGVVRDRGVFISFIEDSRSGSVTKVREGEAIGGGTLSGVTLDYISYNLAQADTRVEIGQTLEGRSPETASSSYYSGGGSYSPQGSYETRQTATMQPAAQTAVSEDEAKDILQRLKERRKKELAE